uniref:Uncharacterized protein n=1 Tax=Phlebotomus papatasi TaxID=29031 RepID=A0A1B0GQ24_PHLPP
MKRRLLITQCPTVQLKEQYKLYNNTPSTVTGVEPNTLMLNFKPRTTWTILNKKGEEKIRNDPEEKSKEERKSIPKKKNKEQKQQPRKSKIPLVEKQEVLYFDALSRIWTRGRVHKRISPTVYIVDFGGTHKKCHRDQLKPFIRTPPPATPPPNTDGDDPFVTPPQGSVTEPPKRKRRRAILPTTPVIRRIPKPRPRHWCIHIRGILEGSNEATSRESIFPSPERILRYWSDIFKQEGSFIPDRTNKSPRNEELEDMWEPITIDEVKLARLDPRSAAGIDRISVQQFQKCPVHVRTLLFNVLLLVGHLTGRKSCARTVFLPKVEGSSDPKDYRPISITSVITRQFHKILAARLTSMHEWDERRAGFLPVDGCGENLAILNELIRFSRVNRRELHLGSLDISKAFNMVSRQAIINSVAQLGAPQNLVEYLRGLYANNQTTLEYGGSELYCRIKRDVRQCDPLSPLLFNLVMESALGRLDKKLSFSLYGVSENGLVYADDVILVASTSGGLKKNTGSFLGALREIGLDLNLAKCRILSLKPSDRDKRCKVPRYLVQWPKGGVARAIIDGGIPREDIQSAAETPAAHSDISRKESKALVKCKRYDSGSNALVASYTGHRKDGFMASD